MGKPKAPKTPDVPDPVDAIEAQARVNRVNTVSPFGSTRFVSTPHVNFSQPSFVDGFGPPSMVGTSGRGGLDKPSPSGGVKGGSGGMLAHPSAHAGNMGGDITQITELSPELQAVFNDAVGFALTDTAGPGDFGRDSLEDAIFGRQMRLLEPQFERQDRQLRQSLFDRGLPTGAEAADAELNLAADQRNRIMADLADAAVMSGEQAFLNRSNLMNQQEQIDFGQLASLLGLTPNQPIAPIDAQGAINNATNAANAIYGQQSAAHAQGQAGLGGLIGNLGLALALL